MQLTTEALQRVSDAIWYIHLLYYHATFLKEGIMSVLDQMFNFLGGFQILQNLWVARV